MNSAHFRRLFDSACFWISLCVAVSGFFFMSRSLLEFAASVSVAALRNSSHFLSRCPSRVSLRLTSCHFSRPVICALVSRSASAYVSALASPILSSSCFLIWICSVRSAFLLARS
jgi:hypothetical protein